MNEIQVLILEISVITLVVSFFAFLIGRYIYRKVKGLPTGECAYCHKGTKQMLKEYHKCYCSCKK